MSEYFFSPDELSRTPITLSVSLPLGPQTGHIPYLITDLGISTKAEVYLAQIPGTSQTLEVDPSQLWFWTQDWQDDEQRVEYDLQTGQYEEFDNIDDFIDSL